ncbi:MAG: phthalate 4,5-dioxygenase [Betaproteobacteria bacterium RIFCSPLOWO2_12_FULL_68_20]|nr:MAG: phthalate 4,5-dioxygenase [Betaproteobacteria bacterium RIFCSPLOWO2_12_FULL_68_20]
MLSAEKNRVLTRVGAGTPMGELLRRYWQPIGAVSEFDAEPIKPIRLMGEDLVLYRDLSGTFGLVDRRCRHRSADLAYGYVEKHGLRCLYHGWTYDESGRCIEQPFEQQFDPKGRLKARIRTTAYPVQAKAGLLWVYLGPQPAPLLPDWEPYSWENGFRQIVFADVPCNWLQCQENSIDPVHFEWAHSNWSIRQQGKTGPYSPAHRKLAFDEFDYGFVYKRVREDTDEEHPLWTTGRVCLWPNGFFLGGHFEWRVPVDDENMLSVMWSFIRVPNEAEPYVQERIPCWRSPIRDPQTGRWISSHVVNQDIIAWVGQGRIADRTRENLGASDRGVSMVRKQYFKDLEAIAAGRDPKGLIRDPGRNRRVELPTINRRFFREGLPRREYEQDPLWGKVLEDFRWHYGQPDEVRREFRRAMGLD